MNPMAILVIITGCLLAVTGFKNHQDNLMSAVVGHHVGEGTLT